MNPDTGALLGAVFAYFMVLFAFSLLLVKAGRIVARRAADTAAASAPQEPAPAGDRTRE